MSDLRVSIGAFFALAGLLVTATGIVSRARAPLDTVNINLYSGVVLFAFGLVMLWLAKRRR
jgi:putative Ca2+/H+ antiporter (TMEM165/GDT1 family)